MEDEKKKRRTKEGKKNCKTHRSDGDRKEKWKDELSQEFIAEGKRRDTFILINY